MKQETAVEWLQWALVNTILTHEQVMQTIGLFEQAKDMFEQQAFELWDGGIKCTEEGGKSFDQYYNETFKSE